MDDDVRGLMTEVPKTYAPRFAELVDLTDRFCDARLNAEYKELCRDMAAAICQEGSPVRQGKIDIRMAPRDAQVVAYEKGLIPYIPAERQEPLKSDHQ